MRFVPVPITGGPSEGGTVLFSIWDTRRQDYEAFVMDTQHLTISPPVTSSPFALQMQLPRGVPIATPLPVGPTHPIVNINWVDATAFCAWITVKEHAAGTLPANAEYRLPTDHEWSCAVGIGRRERADAKPREKSGAVPGYPWGNSWPMPKKIADLRDNTVPEDMRTTVAVGSYPANEFGLFDMAGNAFQWCQDLFDPVRPIDRVRRGSPWFEGQEARLRSSYREGYPAASVGNMNSFRPVIAIAPGGEAKRDAGGDDLLVKQLVESPEFGGIVTVKVKGDHVRQDASGNMGDFTMLIDLTAGTATTLVAGKQTAYTVPLQALLEKSALAAQMQAKGGTWSQPVATGKKGKFGPWATEIHKSTWGSLPVVMWVTSDIPDWSSVRDRLRKMSPALGGYGFDPVSLDVPGLAVKTTLTAADGRKSTYTVLSVTRTTLPESDFVTPKGYAVAPLPELRKK